MAMHSFSSGHTTIIGGIGGSGGHGLGGGIGGDGGNGEGPQFNVSGAENWNVTVYGDLRVNPEARNQSLHTMRQKDHKLCPLPVSSFTGRKDILQGMHQHFDCNRGSRHIFVLHGLGGSGKSELAFKFLQDSQAHHRFSEIFYIDATNEQTLKTDLDIIAPAVVGKSAEASLHWLAGKQEEWLLFFDNADDVQLDISKFFPHCTFGNILITTRNQELCIHASAGSRVSDMEPEDAKDLLLQLAYRGRSDKQKKLNSDEQEKLAVAIVSSMILSKLKHDTGTPLLCLAVSQAGGYIHARGKLSGYLKLYQSHRDQLLQHAEIQKQDQYGLAVYATWNLSYKKLSSPGRTMLQICSSLHHEGISEEIFEKASVSQEKLDDSELQKEVTQFLSVLGKQNGNWDSLVFHRVMGELESYSLIERDEQNDSYRIHPLVHGWSVTTVETNRHLLQKSVLSMIGLSISWSFKDEDYKYRRKLLQHVTRSLDSLNKEEICTFVATRIALVYFEGGWWKDAEALFVVVMEVRKRVLGEEHPSTLTSMASLASTYRHQGHWKDAEALEVEVMEMRKRVLGEEHPDTLTSMGNLASTYWNQGRWKDAEALFLVVMEMSKRVLGEEHPGTLKSMANLASTYRKQGRWKDAEVLEVVVMEMSKRVQGEEHPSTLTIMANLASTYWNQGRWKDAEALFVVVMEMRKCVLGEEHPDTLKSMANLASTYQSQGRWRDAEALEVVVMEMSKCVLGEEHPDTLTSMSNLASTYRNQGCWKNAEALFVVVMEMSKRVLGEEHPDTLTSMANLASTYWNQGRWKDAEALEVEVMEIRKCVLGEEHPSTLISMGNLASTYGNQGRWKDAEALEVVVMEMMKCVLGEEHPETLTSMGNLASTYWNQGRWKDAEALEVVVMEMRKRVLGEEHPDTLTSMGNLASTYWNQGRWKDAEALEVVVMEMRKRVLGEEHPDTLTSMANLVSTYGKQGRWKDAEVLKEVVMEMRKHILGEEHPDTLTSMANLVSTYQNQAPKRRFPEVINVFDNEEDVKKYITSLSPKKKTRERKETCLSRATGDSWLFNGTAWYLQSGVTITNKAMISILSPRKGELDSDELELLVGTQSRKCTGCGGGVIGRGERRGDVAIQGRKGTGGEEGEDQGEGEEEARWLDLDGELDAGVTKVQWFWAKAEMYRWLEQYEWKHAELLHVIKRYCYDGKVWAGLAEREEGLNGVNGTSIYACMKAAMCRQLVHNAEVIFKSADSLAYHDWVSVTSFDEMMGKIDKWGDKVFKWIDDLCCQRPVGDGSPTLIDSSMTLIDLVGQSRKVWESHLIRWFDGWRVYCTIPTKYSPIVTCDHKYSDLCKGNNRQRLTTSGWAEGGSLENKYHVRWNMGRAGHPGEQVEWPEAVRPAQRPEVLGEPEEPEKPEEPETGSGNQTTGRGRDGERERVGELSGRRSRRWSGPYGRVGARVARQAGCVLEGSRPREMDGPDGRTDCADTLGGQPDGSRKDIEQAEVDRTGRVGADELEPGTVRWARGSWERSRSEIRPRARMDTDD
ncbi:hypothetical protein B0H14DRAFT_3172584 [Mycena olivaceomarginata]|nr:hypothetical protein B0H14DRAFT_3172584 [Mycena olivaceomarginata]